MTTNTMAWIQNPITGEWISYPFVGTTPTVVLVEAPSGKIVSFARKAVQWEKPSKTVAA